MDETPLISSVHNPRVRQLARLHKRSERDERGIFIVEGVRPLERALLESIELIEAYFCPELFGSNDEMKLVDDLRRRNIPLTQLTAEPFTRIAYRKHPEGILAIAKQKPHRLDDLKLSDNPFLIVLEAVEKPGNLGTILRTADAVGADGIIVCDLATDIYNPNVIRASTGTAFSVPVAVCETDEAITYLQERAIAISATTPHTSRLYTDEDYTGPVALAMGAEDTGLTDKWIAASDKPVRLPMRGIADSLNVSAATVVVAYEILRQRGVRE